MQKKLTGQTSRAYKAFDGRKSQRTTPQNLGQKLLPASFFQVVVFIHSFIYLLFLFIGKPYCSFPLILVMHPAWQINTFKSDVRGAKKFPKIWEQLQNSWLQKGNWKQVLYWRSTNTRSLVGICASLVYVWWKPSSVYHQGNITSGHQVS